MSAAPLRMQRWLPRIIAASLFILAFALVGEAQTNVGIARDETVYMTYGSRYAEWWTGVFRGKIPVSEKTITSFFGGTGATDNNREHPPLLKTLSGLSERWLRGPLGVSRLTAFRLPAIALNALLIVIIFAWTRRLWGLATGVIAALLTLLLPRAFFHAGIACFDGPIVTLWVGTLYAYWRGLTSPRWRIVSGIVFGLALATKHNAILLPFVVGPHYVGMHVLHWVRRRGMNTVTDTATATGTGTGTRTATGTATSTAADTSSAADTSTATPQASAAKRSVSALRQHSSLLWPVLLGPLTLIALWPWLWFHPIAHIKEWLSFHFTHVHYNFEYLGHNWNAPRFPWHVALVTTLFTVPAATLTAAACGAAVGVQGWVRELRQWRKSRSGDAANRTVPDESATAFAHRHAGLLLALSAAASMGPFFLGSTPIFGAEKHWAPAIPSICIAAAVGIAWAARRIASLLTSGRAPAIALAVVGTCVVASAAVETRQAQPYALTYYNAFAGGAPGGADLGMNRQFWGIAVRGALPFIASQTNVHAIYSHDASPAWGWYQNMGLAPKSLPDAGPEAMGIDRSDIALVVHERHFLRHDYMIWKSYGTVQPVFVLRSDGVPIVSVYRRPPPPPPQAPVPPVAPTLPR